MFQQTDTKRVLFVHTLRRLALGLFVVLSLGGSILAILQQSSPVSAATNNTVNFQARLLSGAGNVAPDGNYNVEFKIYNAESSSGSTQGTCSGDAACLWTETRTSANRVRVANGYLSVSLGSVTAFPTNMDWSQDMWLTMNIGGSSVTAAWDGEMNPRLHLTAVPYAMSAANAVRATSADILQNNDTNASTLGWATQSTLNSILLPNASGTVCLAGTPECGFVQNGTTGQTANFAVQSASAGSVTGKLQGASGQTADVFQVADASNNSLFRVGATGDTTFKNNSDSVSAFNIQNAGGQSLLTVDTTNTAITIGSTSGLDTFTALSNPATTPTGTVNGTTYSSDGKYMVASHAVSPYISIYKINKSTNTFTKIANPSSLPSSIAYGAAFSPDNKYLTVSHFGSPYMTIYKVDAATDTFTKLTNPASMPTDNATAVAYSSDGKYMTVVQDTSPFINIYSVNSSTDTFTRLSDPASLPVGTGRSVSFSPNGQYMSVVTESSPYIFTYKINKATNTFTKLADPTALYGTIARDVEYSPDGKYLSVATFTTPYMTIYKVNSATDTFTRLSNPASVPTGVSVTTTWSPDGNYLTYVGSAAGGNAINIYKRTGDTFTKLANPSVMPSSTSYGAGWSSDGLYTSVGFNTAPYMYIYRHGAYASVQGAFDVSGGLMVGGRVAAQDAYYDNELASLGQVKTLLSQSGASTNAILQGGNGFGSDMSIGTTDNYGLGFKVNGTTVGSFTNTGAATFQNSTDSTTAYSIKNAGGSSLFAVDTSNTQVTIGASTSLDTLTKLADPASLPAGTGQGVSWSGSGNYLAVANNGSPYISIYKRSGELLTKLSNPTGGLPSGETFGVDWSADDTYLSLAINTSPYIITYKRSGDTFAKLTNPASLPAGAARSVAWSSDNVYLTVAHDISPYITIYKRSGDTLTKLNDPAALPTGFAQYAAWSPDNVYLTVAHNTTPYVTIYKRSGDTFTKLSNPASLPSSDGYSAAWSPDGQYMTLATLSTPYIVTYKRSGDTFTKLSNPASLPSGAGYGVSWSPDNTHVSISSASSPYLITYKRSDDTFTKLSDPTVLPGGTTGSDVAYSPDGQFLSVAIGATSPYFVTYKSGTRTVVNGTLQVNSGLVVGGRTSGQDAINANEYTTLGQLQNFLATANSNDILQGGNSFGADMNIGTNDAYGLNFKVGGSNVATFSNAGAAIFKNASDSTTAFRVQNAAGTTDVLSVNTTTPGVTVNGTFTNTGAATFQNVSDSASALAIKNAAGNSLFNIDTANDVVTIGSGSTSTVIANNGAIGSWTATSTLPIAKQFSGSVTANGYIYNLGGSGSVGVYYAKQNADGTTGTWNTTTALPVTMNETNAVVIGNYVYVIGGRDVSNNPLTSSYYARINPDGTLGSWLTTTALPVANAAPSLATVNGYAYVIGGGYDTSALSAVYYAKQNTNGTLGTWTSTTALSTGLRNMAVAVSGGYIYLVGGHDGGSSSLYTRYAKPNSDGSISAWNNGTNMGTTRYGARAMVSAGYLYVFGGARSGSGLNEAFYTPIDPVTGANGSWTALANLPATRNFLGGVMLNGYAYLVGGGVSFGSPTDTTYYAKVQTTNIKGAAVFAGSVSGNDAVNSNEFTTLRQVNGLIGAASAADILNGGNSFGSAMTIGTNDNYGLNFEVNDSSVLSLTSTGATVSGTVWVNSVDAVGSGNTLTIAGANAGTVNIANNAAAHTINIGTGAAVQTLTVGSQYGSSATTIQGGTSGVAFRVASSGSYGWYINSTNVLGIDSAGAATFRPLSDSGSAFIVATSGGATVLRVDTTAQTVFTEGLIAGNGGIVNQGALVFSGSNTSSFLTPQGSNVSTKINIPLYDPGMFSQVIAMGLPSGANANSRVISIFDGRTGAGQTPLAIFSRDEANVLGLGWDGSTTRGYLKSTGGEIGIRVNGTTDIAAFTATGASITGTLAASSDTTIGGTLAVTGTSTFSGDVLAKRTGNSATAFDIQNNSSQSLFLVNTSTSKITMGNGVNTTVQIGGVTNNATFDSATSELTFNGNARHTRRISLQPEFVGAVLDAANDATCASANSGTMTSSLDLTNRKNYYNWSSTSGSAQCYDIVVQVPIPSDFSAWSSSTPLKVNTRTSNTSNGTANVELRDSTGSVIYNYVSVTPGSTNTWTENTVATTISGTYTAGDYITLRVRVSSQSSANIQLGAITLDYLSKW